MTWLFNRLLHRAPIPFIIAALFYVFAGGIALSIYLAVAIGTAFTVQAITYLQHWGLSEKETPELADYGFAWEDGCWMQACLTLNHAFHGHHHLDLRRPYYQLSMMKGGLPLPASYPVMFVAALFPPFFTHIMHCRLTNWIDNYDERATLADSSDCIGAVQIRQALRRKPAAQRNAYCPKEVFSDFATVNKASGDKS